MARAPRRTRTPSGQRFEEPPRPSHELASEPGESAEEQFAVPPGEEDEEEATRAEGQASAAAYAVDVDLRNLKEQIERLIFTRPSAVAAARALENGGAPPEGVDLITGVGIGPAHRDFESVGPAGPGAPVLNVYVAEKMNAEEAKAIIVDGFGVRSLTSDRRPINVIHTGPIDAFAHRHRERPAPCGISVGHVDITAGTLGSLARGRSGLRRNRLLLLSNNHVIANSNEARTGDSIIQPGPDDQGLDPDDRIAILEKWIALDFSTEAQNYVDAATGWCWPDRVRKEFIYRSGGAWAYFSVGSAPTPAVINMPVGKTGRTTQLTSGRVIDVSASIRVNYGASGAANFRDQITVKGNNMQFSRPGDSGSLVWTWETRRLPVGLLFAGGEEFTFANKIHRVLDALDIDLYT